MRKRQTIPRGLDPAGFSYRAARSAGVGRGRLYLDDVRQPFRGVNTVGVDLDDPIALCRAYATRMRPGQYFSHVSAAFLHDLPLPLNVDRRRVHVSVFRPGRAPKLDGVRSYEVDRVGQQIGMARGLPAFSAEDAWSQLRSTLEVTDLVVIGDYLVTGSEPYSRHPPPSSLAALETTVARLGAHRGITKLRTALGLIRYGSLSPQETRLRLTMIEHGLPEPELNFRVHDSTGRFLGMVDLAYPARRIAIEYLGDHHRTDRKTYRDDIRRRERLVAAGWTVIFVTADDLHIRRADLIQRIRDALRSPTAVLFSK